MTDGVNGNQVGLDVAGVLDPVLADNGGPTFTHALIENSPAIDAGSNDQAAGSATDQRGLPRLSNGTVDIGAFEIQFLAPPTYSWSGVLQPINADGSSIFKAGRTVPVKFQLTGESAGITDLVASLSFAKISDTVLGAVNEATPTSAATTGNLFRYDATSGQYIFNWSTKGLSAGAYQLQIDLSDGVARWVNLALK
ncbi:MAG: PxKF domain-containing protein [Verrucomicrobiales bacterium]|nr:PxKF domain-containing protein [Verrucomicrobiales bacterium]